MKRKIIVAICILIFFPLGLYIGAFHKLPLATTASEFGEFGSFIAGICGLIAAVASVFAVIHAIKAFKRQNKQFDRQSFENSFFNLISNFNQRISSLSRDKKNGSAVFDLILTDFKIKTDGYLSQLEIHSLKVVDLVNKTYKNEFSVLLLSFKTITEYIDKSQMPENVKLQFMLIFYSNMTLAEVELLHRLVKVVDYIKPVFDKYPNKLFD